MKSYKALACIQIIAIVCLSLCNVGTRPGSAKKLDAFPCKGHLCGCTTESDCKTHCCCAGYGNSGEFLNKGHGQNDIFSTVISSVTCSQGTDSITITPFSAKYIISTRVQHGKDAFLCILFNDTSICLPDVFLTPPEKPPRHFV